MQKRFADWVACFEARNWTCAVACYTVLLDNVRGGTAVAERVSVMDASSRALMVVALECRTEAYWQGALDRAAGRAVDPAVEVPSLPRIPDAAAVTGCGGIWESGESHAAAAADADAMRSSGSAVTAAAGSGAGKDR